MRDYLDIGSSPVDEDCVQLSREDPDYLRKQRIECRAYIEALIKKLGEPPSGAELKIKRNEHDFGPYLEVICEYEDTDQDALNYAFSCESDGPQTWAEVGMEHPTF